VAVIGWCAGKAIQGIAPIWGEKAGIEEAQLCQRSRKGKLLFRGHYPKALSQFANEKGQGWSGRAGLCRKENWAPDSGTAIKLAGTPQENQCKAGHREAKKTKTKQTNPPKPKTTNKNGRKEQERRIHSGRPEGGSSRAL